MKFPRYYLAIILTLISTTLSWTVPTHAETQAPPFVEIPVLYLTDGNERGDTFGAERRYVVDCQHYMYYGTAYYRVNNELGRSSGSSFEMLGWHGAEEASGKITRKNKLETGSPEKDKSEFFQLIAGALDRSGSNRLCLFIHGAADPFEDAVADAAELEYYLNCPVILYSCPSNGKLRKYRIDEGNAEWSQQHYNTFLKELEDFSEQHPLQLSLVAHSVGNRLLARSVGVMRKATMITDASLVSPDIDAEIFKHYVMNYQSRGAKVRLYVSNRDKVLPFTQMLYGGYYRLGEGVGSILAMVSTAPQSFGRARQGASKPLSTKVSKQNPAAASAEHLEKIDFTNLDKRWIGHNFPFALVSSLIQTGKPGPGLALLPEKAGKGNKFARFARWLNDLPPTDETTPGYCKRVVKVPDSTRQEAANSHHQ